MRLRNRKQQPASLSGSSCAVTGFQRAAGNRDAGKRSVAMKTSVQSAVSAGVITVISGTVLIAGAPRELVFLALPTLPGYYLTFFLGVGPDIEGIPAPTNIAIHVLTFVVWWAIVCAVLTLLKRRRHQ
jgi:hypothetical protein